MVFKRRTPARTFQIVGWCVILVGAVALIKAARAFALAFQTSPQLRNQGVHGNARNATESEAHARLGQAEEKRP